jgi:hypothetical protein
MFVRLPLLLLLLLALTFGSLPLASACVSNTPQACASACCSQADMSCCESKIPASQLPAQAAPSSVEGKQFMAPVLAVLCVRPESVVEVPVTSKQRAARIVVAPRVAVTCIRLI